MEVIIWGVHGFCVLPEKPLPKEKAFMQGNVPRPDRIKRDSPLLSIGDTALDYFKPSRVLEKDNYGIHFTEKRN